MLHYTCMGRAKHSLEEFIKTDRESFRAQATAALEAFGPEDRELAASLEDDHTTTDDVLRAWSEQIEPVYEDLEAKRTDAKFKKTLIRQIGFNDDEADRAIDYLVDERKSSLLSEVLDNLYPLQDEHAYQRGYATDLLTRPEAEITSFMDRYIDFAEAVDASNQYKVLILDPHASWIDRQRTAMQINKERQATLRDEDARLDEIDLELRELVEDENSLVAPIVDRNWDFATVLDLRAKYEKQSKALSKSDQKSPAKKLKLFERITSSFRDQEAERQARAHHSHNLKQLRSINEDIYNLLLEVFDLSAAARNKLLLDIQTYTKLTRERDLILLVQRNREQFLDA